MKSTSRIIRLLPAAALALGLVACGGGTTTDTATTTDGGDAAGGSEEAASGGGGGEIELALASDVRLDGAGASFPAPIYQRWFQEFSNAQDRLQVNYQSVGSGAGVEQFTQGTVDFGASDVAMTDEEIDQIDRGVILLPMTAGSIVLAYNVPGVDTGLQLTREAYVDILLGEITNWNDPAIAEANPDVDLPDQSITVVSRSDGSGTTGVFTKHLSDISEEFESQVGSGKTVQWPVGIAGKGNEGITAQIKQNPGAIGYIEYGYAINNDVTYAALENAEGNFILPDDESASKTLEAVDLPENLRAFITDPQGPDSYPVVTYTWMMVYESYEDPDKAKAVEGMVQYGLTEGQEIAPELGYVKLPQNVRERVAEAADGISPDFDITVN